MITTRKYPMLCTRMGHRFNSYLEEVSEYSPSYKGLPECPKCGGDSYPYTAFGWGIFSQALIKKIHRLELDIMDLQAAQEPENEG